MSERFHQRVIRAAKPQWSALPTSGEGAAAFGGRFNPIGMPALYTSLTLATCAREVRFGLNSDPFTFYHLDVESDCIVDLTSALSRQQFGIEWQALECPNWESDLRKGLRPRSHAMVHDLQRQHVHGILVPSFAHNATHEDVNLVLWSWDEAANHSGDFNASACVRVMNADQLPKDQSSWR